MKNTKTQNVTKTSSNKANPFNRGYRILAGNQMISNDTHKTHLNNNDLIIGGTGKGKTRGYIMPNINNATENSIVVADTKGNLYNLFKDSLEMKGYKVRCIDFKDLAKSESGYNPFDYIRIDEFSGKAREQDIMKIASFLCPLDSQKEPFWDYSAQNYVCCAISYLLETAGRSHLNMRNLIGVINRITSVDFESVMNNLQAKDSDSYAVKCYAQIAETKDSEKTQASIMSVLRNHMAPFMTNDILHIYSHENSFRFEEICEEKTALFLNISDSESSLYRAVSMFYTNMFNSLIDYADKQPNCQLKVPVHIYMDDFATNAKIPDFDNIISVIRSREISVSIILQNISQLVAKYGDSASTIIANCDHTIYLGGADQSTAKYLSYKMNIMDSTINTLPVSEKTYIMESGRKYIAVDKLLFDTSCIQTNVRKISLSKSIS